MSARDVSKKEGKHFVRNGKVACGGISQLEACDGSVTKGEWELGGERFRGREGAREDRTA